MDLNNDGEQLQTSLLSEDTLGNNGGDNPDSVAESATGFEEEEAWYSNPHQVTAMLSNFSTSYNVVNISLVLPILEQLHNNTNEDAAACASSLLAGMVLGQIVGGALGDSFLGRLGALRLVVALQIFASIATALLSDENGDIFMALAAWRFILGVGAGGVYPLAAVLSAEMGSKKRNQSSSDLIHRVVLTFSMQGLGFVAVPIVAVTLLYFTTNLELVWRLILGFGCVPGIVLMCLQCKLYASQHTVVPLEEPAEQEESATEHHNNLSLTNDEEEPDAIVHVQRHGWWESLRQEPGLARKVIGTAGTWFLFDVVFYGNTIFQPIVVEAAFGGSAKSNDPLDLLRKTAKDSLALTSIALPGYFIAGAIIGKRTLCFTQTPRYVMLQGFAAMGILYFAIGLNWSYLRQYPGLLVFLYGMTFFFANYGPNTTTFILPSLLYSPECRSTWNGISAASGKLGALLGATMFEPAAEKWGDSSVMMICASLAIFAFFLTFCFVPKEEQNGPDQSEEETEEA